MKSDLEIAQAAQLRPILEIAEQIGLERGDLEPYGWYKAKAHLDVRERLAERPSAKYIDVTAITPTPLGEGKTTTMVGVAQALGSQLGRRVITCIRQPSMGPTIGIKGGAAGGATPRSCRWRTSTSTSPATSTPSVWRITWPPPPWTAA